LSARRQAMAYLFAVNRHYTGNAQKLSAVHKLFAEIAPRFADRSGGYTRVVRTRIRPGDKAQLALIQFVEESVQRKEKRKRRTVKRAPTPAQTAAAASETVAGESGGDAAPKDDAK
jgi:hypothetical protein